MIVLFSILIFLGLIGLFNLFNYLDSRIKITDFKEVVVLDKICKNDHYYIIFKHVLYDEIIVKKIRVTESDYNTYHIGDKIN